MPKKSLHLIIKNLVGQYGADIVGNHRLKGLLADELGDSFDCLVAFEQAYKMGVGKKLLALRNSASDVTLKLEGLKQGFALKSLMERPMSDYVVDCMAYGLGLVKSVKKNSLEGTTIAMTRKITQLNAAIARKESEMSRKTMELAVQAANNKRMENHSRKIRLTGIFSIVIGVILLAFVTGISVMDAGRIPKSSERKNQRLLEASAAGDAVYVSELIRAGAYINTRNSQGETPLALALKLDAVALVDSLNVFLKWDVVSLYDEALAQGALNVASRYKAARDLVLNTKEMFVALSKGDDSRIRALLDAGVDVHSRNSLGETLLFAAVRGDNLVWAKKLMTLGLAADDKDWSGHSAYQGVRNATARYVRDVAHRDEFFVYAVRDNKMDSAKYFLDLGADVNYVDKKNHYAAVHYGVHYNNVDALKKLKSWGADLNMRTSRGTPIELAMAQNCQKSFRYLLTAVPGIANQELSNGERLLHRGIRDSRRFVWVKALIAAGANIHQEDAYGNQPIHVAAQYGDSNLVKVFIDGGVDPKVKNKDGLEVVEIAEKFDNKSVERYMSQYYITRRIKGIYNSVHDFIAGIF